MESAQKPHAVCVPYPAQGHISPMLKLAKLLHHKGFHITFVHTEFNYNRLLNSRGPKAHAGSPGFRFETIPDGLPPPANPNATQDITELSLSTAKNCFVPFRNLLHKLNKPSPLMPDVPPVSCIISDGVMSFTLQAAEELGVPEVLFWTVSAFSFMCYLHYPHLRERGFSPLKDESCFTNGYMDTNIDWIPGTGSIRLRDIPTPIWTADPKDKLLEYVLGELQRVQKASAIVLNTFDALEYEVLKPLSSMHNRLYTVGPLHLLHNHVADDSTSSIRSNLWKEDTSCLQWLEAKKPGSVACVNFGSITVMTPQQLVEFAWGLANSMQNFLWIIRTDLVTGEQVALPPEFMSEIEGRGLLASWCDQEQVLNHPSVGGFLTHCGWNSTLESLCAGVPMICWPFFSDQKTNCFCMCRRWGVGIEVGNDVKQEEVEKAVRDLMEGAKGKEMKAKVMEWKKKAEEATSSSGGGSSCLNLDKMVAEVLSCPPGRNVTPKVTLS
ncbi:hypothetical protein RJ640_007511 [Escallonia rubra]|uniref:Glycosyltransferase n=1 Tax=Escallonia rubra TaxID=112253 RepID=A0AA88QIB9_9ASTE|nr:hypothetical protein RJ640_007511 [Escallonia rubra]